MRPDMVEAQVAPLARPVEIARRHRRAKLSGLAAAGDSAAIGGTLDAAVEFLGFLAS